MKTNNHQKQIIWQIYLPMILSILVFIFSSFLLFGKFSYGDMNFRIWSDISVLVITMPLTLSFLIIFLFISIVIFLISRLKVGISKASLILNSISKPIFNWINTLTQWITKPVIFIESIISQLSFTKKEKQD
jgi:hypothetical protein